MTQRVLTLGGPQRPAHAILNPAGLVLLEPAGEPGPTLVVADLHLEKGSSFTRFGGVVPPYDTLATLLRLEAVVARVRPARIVCLGDSFHDGAGPARLDEPTRQRIRALGRGRELIWVLGNHDPRLPEDLGGAVAAELTVAGLALRHQPAAPGPAAAPELVGHFHPKARVAVNGVWVSRRSFVADEQRLILPAFGAYTGGLDVQHGAIRSALAPRFAAWLIGRARLLPVAYPSDHPNLAWGTARGQQAEPARRRAGG